MATKNIVPNADTEGQLGTSTKGWGKIFLGGSAANIDVNDVSGTNTAGKSLTLISGASTGSGAGGSIVFQTAAAGESGTSVNSHATVLTLDSTKLATFAGNVVISGNMTVNGTTTTVNSTIVTIDDPVFTLGGDTAPASETTKDKGIEFRYHTGSAAKVGFFGWDDDASAFTFIPDATNNSEVFSGSAGNVIFNDITAASLDISGAVDIAGDLTLSAGADGALNFSAASSIKILDNSATSLVIEEADTAYMTFVTTNSSEAIKFDKALDINAAVQLDSTLTVGVNDTGYDVKFFGATSGKSLLWDESADSLIVTGTTDLIGTTNLDIVDIDGAVNIATTALVTGVLTTTATQVANGGITSGSNIVSDTDSTDDLGTTSVRWANLFVDGITATDQITATGFTGTLDGILGSGTPAAATVTTLNTSGVVNLNLTTDSSSSTSGALIVDGGVGIAAKLFVGTDLDVDGTTNLDIVDIDGAVNIGAEVTLAAANKIIFNDASQFIHASSDAILNLGATDEIDLTATAIDVNGTMDVSGAFTNGSTLVSTGKITADAGIDIDNINIDGTTIALSSGDLTLDVEGDIVLDANGGDITLKDGGTSMGRLGFENGDLNISAVQQDYDIRLKGFDGNATNFTALLLDMSEAGAATFSGAITSGDITTNGNNKGLYFNGTRNAILGNASTEEVSIATANVTRLTISSGGTITSNISAGDNLVLEKPTGAYLVFKNETTIRGSINGNNGTDGLNLNYGASHTPALTISSGGVVSIPNGVIFNNNTTGGTPNATGVTLNDYEEGTWTPTVVAASGTYTTVTNQRGTYTKIGRKVTVQFYFIVSDKGTGTDGAQITNLPFTVKSTTAGDQYVGSMINTSTSVISSVIAGQNSTTAGIYKYDGTDPITVTQGNAGSLTYFV
jgi:hypothetical protein